MFALLTTDSASIMNTFCFLVTHHRAEARRSFCVPASVSACGGMLSVSRSRQISVSTGETSYCYTLVPSSSSDGAFRGSPISGASSENMSVSRILNDR